MVPLVGEAVGHLVKQVERAAGGQGAEQEGLAERGQAGGRQGVEERERGRLPRGWGGVGGTRARAPGGTTRTSRGGAGRWPARARARRRERSNGDDACHGGEWLRGEGNAWQGQAGARKAVDADAIVLIE